MMKKAQRKIRYPVQEEYQDDQDVADSGRWRQWREEDEPQVQGTEDLKMWPGLSWIWCKKGPGMTS